MRAELWDFCLLYLQSLGRIFLKKQTQKTMLVTYRKKIDQTDLKILFEMQQSGRMTVVDLAARVNLSKTPCLQRLKRLEEDGYILGYRARLDPKKIKQGYLVYIQLKLQNTSSDTLNKFNNAVLKTPQILTCHMLSGGYDYLLKVRTSDMASYREVLGDVIADLPGVLHTSTFPVMEEVKDTHLLLIDGISPD